MELSIMTAYNNVLRVGIHSCTISGELPVSIKVYDQCRRVTRTQVDRIFREVLALCSPLPSLDKDDETTAFYFPGCITGSCVLSTDIEQLYVKFTRHTFRMANGGKLIPEFVIAHSGETININHSIFALLPREIVAVEFVPVCPAEVTVSLDTYGTISGSYHI